MSNPNEFHIYYSEKYAKQFGDAVYALNGNRKDTYCVTHVQDHANFQDPSLPDLKYIGVGTFVYSRRMPDLKKDLRNIHSFKKEE